MNEAFTDTVLMIRPAAFDSNPQTLESNAFQNIPNPSENAQEKALKEFNVLSRKIESYGIDVIVVDDIPSSMGPDTVFPNNWISTHRDGKIITYPMFSEIRRRERRTDILDLLEENYGLDRRYGFEYLEEEGLYLEGTGSMVLDRRNRIAYAALGPRTSIEALDKFCVLAGYRKCIFNAVDQSGKSIYHTNVMMAICNGFALVCLESIVNDEERMEFKNTIIGSGLRLVEISLDQVNCFAGNALQLINKDMKPVLAISSKAITSLSPDQMDIIKGHTDILQADIPTIETYGGGSVRCMLLEIFQPNG